MQVTETLSDGLKHEFQVTVPAADLAARMSGRLSELKDRVQLRGFRPGKVPVTHLRKVYGRSVMAETVEAVIREMNAKIVEERGLRLAMEPKVTIPNEETEVERVIGGDADLAYTLSLEVLPKIELADFSGVAARAADRRGHRGGDQRRARQGRRAEQALMPPRARAPRSRRATAC